MRMVSRMGAALDSALTDGDTGNYCFSDVEPRDYVLVEQQPLNYDSFDDFDRTTGALDPDGNDSLELADDDIPVTLIPGEEDYDNDFVEVAQPGTILGTVINDVGIGMPNVTITLYHDANQDMDPEGADIGTCNN